MLIGGISVDGSASEGGLEAAGEEDDEKCESVERDVRLKGSELRHLKVVRLD